MANSLHPTASLRYCWSSSDIQVCCHTSTRPAGKYNTAAMQVLLCGALHVLVMVDTCLHGVVVVQKLYSEQTFTLTVFQLPRWRNWSGMLYIFILWRGTIARTLTTASAVLFVQKLTPLLLSFAAV